ncbi:Response regulator CitB of citrate metabolism [[Actinomadura] parvosata subsp. kistnae]|uniref:Transcriptional regulatory protein n=1 Tax=[Actinomadura] parvosata subsp. kistnae TaxID=1909395 RepID=A0A1V0AFZ6_9ACTN|nr:response regulator [Nonomuraea sp. ATCC 55076]AQZ69099.1 two-component system response regulator [Nonomuraea sp. ATCC 55076]SPL92319.1 Response regulator CitB of citrate metabolism [Actinomadura parvosata subsp. kistnae]
MIRVLVVDDDFMVARIHSGYVGRVPGFSVVSVAHSGAEALAAAAELRPDLVLLDIYLPDMSGLDVLKALHDVDVLMISAARDVPTVREAMRGGAFNYLIKPFTAAALTERLQQYADTRNRLTAIGPEARQDDVDRLFGTLKTAVPMPKGLSAATCALVADTLREAGRDLSAAEAAELTGLSRVSARRYLEHLCAAGQAELRPRYGTAGRPEHRYRWLG